MSDPVLVAVAFIAFGLVAGMLSGLLGIGGAILIVPLLVYIFKFSHHSAQGTFLAMISLPVSALAALTYYRAGNVNIKAALLIGAGFLVGGLIGGLAANQFHEQTIARLFGLAIMIIGAKTLFFP